MAHIWPILNYGRSSSSTPWDAAMLSLWQQVGIPLMDYQKSLDCGGLSMRATIREGCANGSDTTLIYGLTISRKPSMAQVGFGGSDWSEPSSL